jgi:hypothetical protein
MTAGARGPRKLLELDLGACRLELLLDVLGLGLVDTFFDGLGRALDESLRLAQAETRDGADFLDDVDLVLAEGGKDHVELGLFFDRGGRSRCATGGCNRDRRGGRNAQLLFEHLGELGRLEDREGREVVYDLCEISHLFSSR